MSQKIRDWMMTYRKRNITLLSITQKPTEESENADEGDE